MGKAFVGFLVGVALTSGVFALILGTSGPLSPEGMRSESPSPARGSIETGADASSSLITAEEVRGSESFAGESAVLDRSPDYIEIARGLTVEELSDLLRNLTLDEVEELRSRGREGRRVMTLAEAEIDRRRNVEELANTEPPTFPITLPPEFNAWLAENPSSMHEDLQREPIDPAWSPQAEGELYDYFADHPDVLATYGSPTINCRTTGCEIAFVAYGIDNSERARAPNAFTADGYTSTDFARANTSFFERPWAAEQIELSSPSVNTRDGATTILWHLYRRTRE